MEKIIQGSTNFRQVFYPTQESRWRDKYCEDHYGPHKPLAPEIHGRLTLNRVRLHLKQQNEAVALKIIKELEQKA